MSGAGNGSDGRVDATVLTGFGAAALTLSLLATGCTAAVPTDRETPTPMGTATAVATAPATRGQSATPTSPESDTGTLADVPEVAQKLQPSVVTVSVRGGNGSGVIYSKDGLILTNEHVVRGNDTVRIAFVDGQRFAGEVVAVDVVTDLALVRVDRMNLPAAEFLTKLPQVGSLAVVIGSPLGFQNSVTAGVVSALHREIPGSASQGQALVDLIQTDAPISPGNSGGAVANDDGQVIGISEAYIPPQVGAVSLGFAIPAATAIDVAEQLRRNGRARHAFAGLVPGAITPDIAAQLGLRSTDGVIVVDTVNGGPADRAGLRPGDIITAVDGQATPTPEDFLAALRQYEPGDTLAVTAHAPGGSDREIRVTVTDRPK
jgi:serine protease DegQ